MNLVSKLIGLYLLFFLQITFAAKTDISGIVNKYTQVTSITNFSCRTDIRVTDTTNFRIGDTILIIQMQGAVIDSTNTSNFGTILDYNNVGNYELLIIGNRIGNVLSFSTNLHRNYSLSGKVQLVKANYYENANINGLITAPTFNGFTGGVLFINVKDTLIFNNDINLNGLGFRGGPTFIAAGAAYNSMNYFYNNTSNLGANKGEGIHDTTILHRRGRGANANGGGGGNDHNSGGAGGGNGGAGGNGGYQNGDEFSSVDNGGRGGRAIAYNLYPNKLILGGGGGSGHQNAADITGTPGKNGGGVIIILTNYLKGNNHFIYNNGLSQTISSNADGAGGGGAGGSLLLKVNDYLSSTLNIEEKGGSGGNTIYNVLCVGTGGGGGGGALITNSALPSFVNVNLAGGIAGRHTVRLPCANFGAIAGDTGIVIINNNPIHISTNNFVDAFDTILCIGDSVILNYTGVVDSFKWNDGINIVPRVIRNTGTYILTSYTSCSVKNDTFNIQVLPLPNTISLRSDTVLCFGDTIRLNIVGIYDSIKWNDNSHNFSYLVDTSGLYEVTAYSGCSYTKDSVQISFSNILTSSNIDTIICLGDTVQLNINSVIDSFRWLDGLFLLPRNVSTPGQYQINLYNYCGFVTDTFDISILPNSVFIPIHNDTTICNGDSIQLVYTGVYDSILWNNGSDVNSFYVYSDGIYSLDIYAGCNVFKDSVEIKMNTVIPSIFVDTNICFGDTISLNHAGISDSVLWQDGDTSLPRNVNLSGLYLLNRFNYCGVFIDTFNISIIDTLYSEHIFIDTNLCLGTSISIILDSRIDSFLWSNGSTANPLIIDEAGIYSVQSFSVCNRINDTIKVNYIDCTIDTATSCYLTIPSAFTPNNDGLNDLFNVITNCQDIYDYQMRIFNRYGELIFESNDINQSWNGTFKGELQPIGTFQFAIQFKSYLYGNSNELKQFKGSVTLLR